MRSSRLIVCAAALVLLPSGSVAATPIPDQPGASVLLDVPYVTQTPELCGGAALAMVLRYWGERQVFAEDFQPLVVPSERGIPAASLAGAVRDRHWQAVVFPPEPDNARSRIRTALAGRQPLIALIEVSPRTFHYVVMVAATEKEVVIHDPARSPFRVVSWEAFDRAWEPAGRWMMLVLPPTAAVASPPPPPQPDASAAPKSPCEALVERGVSAALDGDRAAAEELLSGATRVCPVHPAAWRELAGLRFSQSRWREAEALAATALRLAPDDRHARELLATSRYLDGDLAGALDAWNPAGEPRIDAVNIYGADRTRHPVVVEAAGLQPRQVLTPDAFGRALRRVQALPVAAGAGIQYEPLSGGLARVDVSVNERAPYPRGWLALGVLGARAAIGSEVRVETAGLFGAGERVSAAGRWKDERPRAAFGLAAPSPWGLPGVASFDVMWERQSYPGERQSRRRAGVQFSEWVTSGVRLRAGPAFDRFDARRHVALDAAIDVRFARDRVAVVASGSRWFSRSGSDGFDAGSLLGMWRSSADSNKTVWSLVAEATAASHAAPLAVWEGAGSGSGRSGLLRAHPVLDDDVVTGAVFGRRMARGTFEFTRPVKRVTFGLISVAAFVDAARAWRRLTTGPSPLFIDAGVGVRFRAPGRTDGARFDLAKGLRGGGFKFSAGWLSGWPR